MQLDQKYFKLIRSLDWEEVFLFWYDNEGQRNNWIDLAKRRGFPSWAAWRLEGYAQPFQCREAKWYLYQVKRPLEIVPTFYGGPFKTWAKLHYQGRNTCTFAQLASLPAIENNSTVNQMAKEFPIDKTLAALLVNDKIMIIEGMHRTCALALKAKRGEPFDQIITMAIGESVLSELPMAGWAD